MKKLFALVFCVLLVLGLAACASKTEEKKPGASKPTASSRPAIGTEIGSEPVGENSEAESSEEASSEETPFDPDGVYDTGKDPFLGDNIVSEYRYENGFEADSGYLVNNGFYKYTSDKKHIHGGKVSLCTYSDSLERPDFYVSIPELAAGAECEITVYVLCETAVEDSVEMHSGDSGAADVSVSLSGLTPGEWSPITATFFATTADIHIKAPAGVTAYFDDLTIVYKQ